MAEIQERHEAVRDLEQSLTGLQQIFLDMSVLVDAQGEMLDNIEQQVGWSLIANDSKCFSSTVAAFLARPDLVKSCATVCSAFIMPTAMACAASGLTG